MEFSDIQATRFLVNWEWRMWMDCVGMECVMIESERIYTTKAGALRAARRWARKHGTIKE